MRIGERPAPDLHRRVSGDACCIMRGRRHPLPREFPEPRARQPEGRRTAAAGRAVHPQRRLRSAGPVQPRSVEERGHHRLRLHLQHRTGSDLVVRADRGRAGRRRGAAALLDRGGLREAVEPVARSRLRRAPALRAPARPRARVHVARRVSPGAAGVRTAAAFCLRRGGQARRLRPRDRRRRAARPDRLARAAPARPRDHAGSRPVRRGVALSVRAGDERRAPDAGRRARGARHRRPRGERRAEHRDAAGGDRRRPGAVATSGRCRDACRSCSGSASEPRSA